MTRCGPPVMTVRWDAYTSDDSVLFTNFLITSNANRVFTQYGHRRPIDWNNHRQWGPGVDAQAVVDAELQSVRGALDWWQYDWYPPPSCFVGDEANMPLQSGLMTQFEAHRVSPYKSLCKYGLMVDPGWWKRNKAPPDTGDWSKAVLYRAHLVACMAEPNYMRIGGRPVLGVYNYAALSAGDKTTWLAEVDVITAATGSLYILVQDHNSNARADHLSHAGRLSRVTYGPNPGLTSTPGQYAWEQQRASDVALWPSSGGGEMGATTITPTQDRRPLLLTDSTAWIDQPTMPQLSQHISAAFNNIQFSAIPDLISYHAWSENTETGPGIIPTIQERRRYLDAISWARNGKWPDSYLYELDAAQLNFTKIGSWVKSAQIFGMFNGDEITSSTTNDQVDFSHERCRHLGVLATTGPDRGIANIKIDGSIVATVDLYSVNTKYQQQVFMSSRLDGSTHSISVIVSGTKNAASSSVKVGYDACRIIYNP